MQAVFLNHEVSSPAMGRPSTKPRGAYGAHLATLRQAAGLTQAQLAEKLGVHHSNIAFWEHSNKPPRGDVLPALASALGVSLEVLLNAAKPRLRTPVAKGRMQQMFEAASRLPRRQQLKIVDLLEPFVREHVNSR
jgi:transcriptional regulator with XRE-family HTH domain